MNIFKKLLSSGVTDIVSKVGEVVDEFHMSKEEKAKLQIEMKSLLLKRDSEIEDTVRTQMDARKAVLVAELTQGDKFTKRARPTVVYAGLGVVLLNNIILPLIFRFTGYSIEPFVIPNEFWLGWSGIVATWSIGRTMEKTATSKISKLKSDIFDAVG